MRKLDTGKKLLALSIFTRFSVLILLCLLGLWTEYLNLKMGYNNPRLVELSSGPAMRVFYECSDAFFSLFGDPLEAAQTFGGMTWSIRLWGVPFTDPIAFFSILVRDRSLEWGFVLGLILPITLVLLFGRVFCTYICPASLLFFTISRIRRLLGGFFYFPNLSLSKGFAWGILVGGLLLALSFGHGIWILILPYFAMGQTIFHGIAFGTISVAFFSLILFSLFDLCLGQQFTCRYICPTGRFLGWMGSKSLFSVRRDAKKCLPECHICYDVCPLKVDPKIDDSKDCSLCGECLVACPTKCLSIGKVGETWVKLG